MLGGSGRLRAGLSFAARQDLRLKEAREALEKDMVQRSLARNRGNITHTANELGISRPTLYELMEKLGIKK